MLVNWKLVEPYDFEKIIGRLYEKLGYTVLVCQATRDKGVDVFVKKYLPEYARYEFFVIQAKKWTRKVGIDEVQRLSGVILSNQANAGILIITSDFSSDAYTQAMTLKNVELINKKSLERKLAEVGIIDFEEIDLDNNDNDQFAQINQILKILKGSPSGSVGSHELLEALKCLYSAIDEKALFELLSKLSKVNRVVLDKNNIIYIPSHNEKNNLEQKIPSEIIEMSSLFPFNLDFLKIRIPKITNLMPEVVEKYFDLTRIISKLVISNNIIELPGGFFAGSKLIEKIKSRLPEMGKYDVFDITDSCLYDSIKEAKKQYNCIGEPQIQAVKAFASLGNYFDQYLNRNTLFILLDFERFIIVRDQRILQVTEVLLTTADPDGIDLERGSSFLKFNYESNFQLFGSLILEVCKKYNTHISSNKLNVKETEY